jgi:hypothetical protein
VFEGGRCDQPVSGIKRPSFQLTLASSSPAIGDRVCHRQDAVTKQHMQVGVKPRLPIGVATALRRHHYLRISPMVIALRNSVVTGCALSYFTTRGSGTSRLNSAGTFVSRR